ncbi:putative proton pump interactor, partial [Trifolium medium]|nr:putative proton pump interactor [Trifolium medium]
MALDELNFMSNKAVNGGWFLEKLDKNLHGSKSMAEEKKILRDIKIQQKEKDVASFKSLEVLKEMAHRYRRVKHIEQIIRQNNYINGWLKLGKEIEQFHIQLIERAFKENISIYESLKKTIKDQIK